MLCGPLSCMCSAPSHVSHISRELQPHSIERLSRSAQGSRTNADRDVRLRRPKEIFCSHALNRSEEALCGLPPAILIVAPDFDTAPRCVPHEVCHFETRAYLRS